MKKTENISLSNAAVGATYEDVGDPVLLYGEFDQATVQVANTGATNALTGFKVLARAHAAGAWDEWVGESVWGTPAEPLLHTSANMAALAAGASAIAFINLAGVHSIKFQAKSTNTSMTIIGKAVRKY